MQTRDTYKLLLGDALHPNAEGMTKISERVVSTIENFIEIRWLYRNDYVNIISNIVQKRGFLWSAKRN